MGRLRILVGITSYGTKNVGLLRQVIAGYRRMDFSVEILIFSEGPKEIGNGADLRVGLPNSNPWSLAFAHKEEFARRVDEFDLFIYSEDDVEVTSSHVESFLSLTAALHDDEIAGFDLYEVSQGGERWLPGMHGSFHWDPASVQVRAGNVVASFSNEHSACYVLTQSQLRRAIASGGYLKAPYAGKYDMLCTAATDPYTSCGMRKVMCVSSIDNFLVHHLPNRYVGRQGITMSQLRLQLKALMEIANGKRPRCMLCDIETKVEGAQWSKSYYEESSPEIITEIPKDCCRLLSIGCGSGEMERELQRRGTQVTALPLDSVIGILLEDCGIEVIYSTLEQARSELKGRSFDCIVLSNLLHLCRSPSSVLASYSELLSSQGCFVMQGPNFQCLPITLRRTLRRGDFRKLRSFDSSGITAFGLMELGMWLRQLGLSVRSVIWTGGNSRDSVSGSFRPAQGTKRLVLDSWRSIRRLILIRAQRESKSAINANSGVRGWLRLGSIVGERWVVSASSQNLA